jgi:type VI secretion system protein ImpA
MLTLALLKLEGLPGLRDGLTLLHRLVSEQWDGIYPRLDPEDNNDPTERVNIIAGLSKPLGAFGDPVRFIERIRTTPLSNSAQMGRFSLAQITQVGLPAGPDATAPAPEQVEAAFRDSSPDDLAVIATAASESRNIVGELDSKLMELVGANQAPSLEELKGVLGEIQQTLAPYLPQDSPAALEAADTADTDAAPAATKSAGGASRQTGTQTASFTGAITSRADVSRAIDEICTYYQQAEPGHPVPLLLRRAQRLVDKDFLALMEDLLPDSLAPLGNLIGQKRDGESAPTLEELPSE